MNRTARTARARVEQAKRELAYAKQGLASVERTCDHQWSDPEYTPDIHKGFQTVHENLPKPTRS